MLLTALTQFDFKVNVEETIEMLPKSRKALTIQEIAALARSSLYGISQAVKDHVTKPTAMAQGRVAHLIEWKGWCRPCDSAAALESHFRSYSHLSEGEQEARFAAGVAEQFAIAEAKLRAWSSVDGEDYEDLCDEDAMPYSDPNLTTQSGDSSLYPQCSHDLWQGPAFQPEGPRPSEDGPAPSGTPCSRTGGAEDVAPVSSPSDLGCSREGEDRPGEAGRGDCRGVSQDSAYAPSSFHSYLETEDEGESSDRDVLLRSAARRKISDEPSSGAMSLEEEEEEEEEEHGLH
ncbi:protein FAM131A [Conger conger]|uniref:protein FAM131A n=1 Tax=Conger conger TaxID=82655 RepID=UPI002A5A10D7|nr:protein FAM131A [Conger conger]